ncbi:bifunctional hydroxymethylpyrimidine kinase/phosphomethylpyrimidine kinase [Erythrobacteraceae bacterium WH01K]|nr:bifunctional hydroxymethylpyrimidine kinase/phosphomethylpyrimidine kinase [Erythrobacteraceae bacterium WH01K]
MKAQGLPPPRILSIAGSDSSGGAGIQADVKTITMLGGYAMTAITAVTAQNSIGVQGITPLEGEFVAAQIRSCIDDIGVDAIKIGMLQNADIIGHVAAVLEGLSGDLPVILDPVMVATSGARLLESDAIDVMRTRLFPLATMLTPNLPELELLSGRKLRDTSLAREAAQELATAHGCAVLAKGGHTGDEENEGSQVIDLLQMADGSMASFTDARIYSRNTHGTGCTLSAAIATLLGHGQNVEHSVRLARQFVREAIWKAPDFGTGAGPLGHQAVRLAGED